MSPSRASRALLVVAGLNAVLHVAGLVLAVTALEPGSPLVPLDARLAYLAPRPLGWSLGWGVWMLCALSLVAFLAVLAPRADGSPRSDARCLASLAVTLAAAGAAVDLFCDVLQIAVLPDIAAWKPPDPALYFAVERAAGAGGTVVANGLYSLAVLLAALALRGVVPAHASWLGATTFAAGMLMAAAGFSGNPRQLLLATGPTIGAYLLWTADVTVSLLRRARDD